MAQPLYGSGTTDYCPLWGIDGLPGQSREWRDRVGDECQYLRCDWRQDFLGPMAAMPEDVFARTVQTAGSPSVSLNTDIANGEVVCVLTSTSEAQYAGIDWADQRGAPANKRPWFNCLAKVSAIAANQRAIIGLASDFNATLDSTDVNAWFRVDGSLALTVETDDGTTNTDDYPTSLTLEADTYYLFTICLSARLGYVQFLVNQTPVAELPFTALPTTTIQPMVGVQKSSGTGVPTVSIDFIRLIWDRF